MSCLSAAGVRAAGFRKWRLAVLCLLGACATQPVKTPAAPPAAVIAATAAAKPKPLDLSRPPAHPIPYGELPHPVKSPEPEALGAPTSGLPLRPLTRLPGWASDDHLAALKAFRDGCGVAKAVEWRAVCARARAAPVLNDTEARRFFEANFMAEAGGSAGLLTAYFAPEYPAQTYADSIFSAPVRALPNDPAAALQRTRAEIEADPADGALAFMKPEDLFFLQIQGAGVLVFPDGRRMKAAYTGDNGLPFTAIARPMLKAGYLSPASLSADAIRTWLADHRGVEAERVMDLDERYIFFDLTPDDGREPSGAAGQPLTAGRALAVDPAFHRYGALYWVDADAPSLNGAVQIYRRLALALDTGAAIRGERRADLYLGRGEAAGHEAGRVRHVLNLVRLIPNALPVLPPPTRDHETHTEDPGAKAGGG